MRFKTALVKTILQNLDNNHIDNFSPQSGEETGENCSLLYHHRGPVLEGSSLDVSAGSIKTIQDIAGQFELFGYLYDILGDSGSKELLLSILSYKILGYKKVKLPSNTPFYWESLKSAAALSDNIAKGVKTFNLEAIGCKAKVAGTEDGVHCLWFLKQYEYESFETSIRATESDIVLDCGACWGDSTVYFLELVGALGKVFAFEFNSSNLEIFKENLRLNSAMSDRVVLEAFALGSKTGDVLYFNDDGPGTTLSSNLDRKLSVRTITIDDFVSSRAIEKVDFIKMDIETSELPALKGGRNTLKRYRPNLAISAYHKPEDLIEIPAFLDSLNLGYRFFLKQATIHLGETVLFATAR